MSKNLVGLVFGKLTVIERRGVNKYGRPFWFCECSCGNSKEVLGAYLKNGDTKSCGCIGKNHLGDSRRKHGLSHKNNTEYEIWKGMKARCYNPNNEKYKDYGGRGIIVCDRWINSFENFLSDMGCRPSKIHSVDRFPNMNGNYEPSNCRWGTTEQQSRNKRNNRWFTFDGKTMVLEDWSKYFNVHQSTLVEHLKTKTFEEVVSFYDKKTNKKLAVN